LNDVFLSYAAEDAAWARMLAEQLRGHGLSLFLDQWNIQPGDVLIHELDRAIIAAVSGIAMISPATARCGRAMEEYAALATASAERGLRFIPVLLGQAVPPPFARNRVWRDFSGVTGQEFRGKAAELAAVITGRSALADGAPAEENLRAAQPATPRPVTVPERPAFVVCYAAGDAAYGRRLARQLRDAALPVWSADDLRPGDAQFWTIRQQLRHAVAVVVIMTPESQDSEDITLMIIEAREHQRTLVPVLLHGSLNFLLAATWYVDARDGGLLADAELGVLHQIHEDVTARRPVRLPEARLGPGAGQSRALRLPAAAALDRLRGFVVKGEYLHADLLTTHLVMEKAGRLVQGWLRERDAAAVPLELLTGIDAVWAGQTYGRQGFRQQLELTPAAGPRELFRELGAALGWRASDEGPVPRLYYDFVQQAGPGKRTGFFPTLRSPQHENSSDWYDRWSSTVLAVHARLRDWKADPCRSFSY